MRVDREFHNPRVVEALEQAETEKESVRPASAFFDEVREDLPSS